MRTLRFNGTSSSQSDMERCTGLTEHLWSDYDSMRMYGRTGSGAHFEAGKDAVVKALLEMDARMKALEQQILVLRIKDRFPFKRFNQLFQASLIGWPTGHQAEEEKVFALSRRPKGAQRTQVLTAA